MLSDLLWLLGWEQISLPNCKYPKNTNYGILILLFKNNQFYALEIENVTAKILKNNNKNKPLHRCRPINRMTEKAQLENKYKAGRFHCAIYFQDVAQI